MWSHSQHNIHSTSHSLSDLSPPAQSAFEEVRWYSGEFKMAESSSIQSDGWALLWLYTECSSWSYRRKIRTSCWEAKKQMAGNSCPEANNLWNPATRRKICSFHSHWNKFLSARLIPPLTPRPTTRSTKRAPCPTHRGWGCCSCCSVSRSYRHSLPRTPLPHSRVSWFSWRDRRCHLWWTMSPCVFLNYGIFYCSFKVNSL